MSSLNLAANSKPLPSLPLELKKAVLRFCDPATLAVTSQVSLALLEMSSPLLYRDVVVTWERLPDLFSERRADSQLSVGHWLSLEIIQDLQVTGPIKYSFSNLHLDRSPGGKPLQIKCLNLDPVPVRWLSQSEKLFSLLDPHRLRVSGPLSREDVFQKFDPAWPCIRSITFIDGGAAVLSLDGWWQSLGDRQIDLHYHLSQDSRGWYSSNGPCRDELVIDWLEYLHADLNWSSRHVQSVDVTFDTERDKRAGSRYFKEWGLLEKYKERMTMRVAPSPTISDEVSRAVAEL